MENPGFALEPCVSSRAARGERRRSALELRDATAKIARRVLRRAAATCVLSLLALGSVAAQSPQPLTQPDLDIRVNGVVNAIVRQTDGAVVIGGSFSAVNGAHRVNLARLLADGSVDSNWAGNVQFSAPSLETPVVYALAQDSSGAIYVGGYFDFVGGQTRKGIAKVSGSTGIADASWDAAADDTVRALAFDGAGALYAGGSFATIGGQSRTGIAKLSTSTGLADASWNPGVLGNVVIYALLSDAANGAVYAGGDFGLIGGEFRTRIAKLSTSGTGVADANWNPNADGVVRALALDAGALYAGGDFTHIGGQPRNFLAKLTGSTGAADLAWNPAPDDSVSALVADGGGSLYVGGKFRNIASQARSRLAKVATSNGTLAAWNPSINGQVFALAARPAGGVIAGGDFSTAGGTLALAYTQVDGSGTPGTPTEVTVPGQVYALSAVTGGGTVVGGRFSVVAGSFFSDVLRLNILRLLPSGALDPDWNPAADGPVSALATDGSGGVYAGGDFGFIGGKARNHIAKLAGSVGAADAAWDASADGSVLALAVDAAGAALYAGGAFANVGGNPHNHIAKLSAATGAVAATWLPAGADDVVDALAFDGASSTLYVGGAFAFLGGQSHNRIARVAAASGAADAAWNPSANGSVLALGLAPEGVYAGGSFTNIGGQPRARIARLSTTTGTADLAWNPSANSAVYALLPSGRGVYAGGFFSVIGGKSRFFLAYLSCSTGTAYPDWNPSAGVWVRALAPGPSSVYAGGDFETMGFALRGALAAVPPTSKIFCDGFE